MTTASTLLREQGLRVTAARVAALDVLDTAAHLSTDEIATAVRERIGSVSVQATYHLLDALTAAGLVHRVDLAGFPARYERRATAHHHLACRGCGHLVDVDCSAEDGPCVHLADRQGFAVERAEVIFWGLCP
ncbi:Fur family transcriptional regulator, partial [Actinotalea sp.]